MTTPIIGKDCDICLVHPDVNSGEPFGFILSPNPKSTGPAFSVQRSLNANDETSIYLFATVILADDLKDPDGGEHVESKLTMSAILLEYLDQTENISIDTNDGTYIGLGQGGHTATELHLVDAIMVSLKFMNIDTYHPPIGSALFYGSQWQPDPAGDGAFTWSSSVWR